MTAKSKLLSLRHNKKKPLKTSKRKLNPEFTTAIRTAKLIRVCAAFMQPDRSRFHRLAKFILHQIIHADTIHNPGERQILIQHLNAFEGYEFDPDHPVSIYLPADIITSIENKITIFIPSPQFIWPENAKFCKIILLGVAIDFQSFTTKTETGYTEWITRNDWAIPHVYIEINNNHPLFIVIGIAYTNYKTSVTTCQAVKIIAVNV